MLAGRSVGRFGLWLCGLCMASGCQPRETRSIEVHWQLIDGRSCADAGAVRAIVAMAGGEEQSGRCSQLPGGNRITIPDAYGDGVLLARAESAGQAVLYRAELRLPHELPSVVELVLSYSGGR